MLQNSFFLGLLVVVSVAFVALLADFFQPIFWAATFSIIFYPLHKRIRSRIGNHESVAALITVLLIFCTVIVPALLIGAELAREAADLYTRIETGEVDPGALIRWAEELLPQARQWTERLAIDMEQMRKNVTSAVVNGSQ
ncbi:MAG: AI-2E family transporter, partial [Gammaproteobacteria bacterium]